MKPNLFIPVASEKIACLLENPGQQKIAIIVHGFSGDMHGPDNIFEKLSTGLQRENFTVLRFNFRGTAPSDMEHTKMSLTTETDDVKAVIKYAREQKYQKIVLIAESFGAASAISAWDNSLAALVFWYPLFDLKDCSFRELLTPLITQELEANGFTTIEGVNVGAEFVNDVRTKDLFPLLRGVQPPLLFLHGDSDTDVPVLQSKYAFEISPEPKEIHILKGADHCFRNEQEDAIELTMQFLCKHVKSDQN